MPKNILIAGLGVLLALMAASSSQAAIVAQYEFTGGVLTSSDIDGNSTASIITSGSGINNSGGNTSIGAPSGSFQFASGDMVNSFKAEDYIEFTVTATSGLLDLSSLSFQTSAQSATETGWWAVRTGTFSTDLATDPISGAGFFGSSINLSSIPDTPSITFRLYAWNDPGDDIDLYFDNIILETATVIPEVGTVWASLLVLGAAIVGKWRFDKRKPANAAS